MTDERHKEIEKDVRTCDAQLVLTHNDGTVRTALGLSLGHCRELLAEVDRLRKVAGLMSDPKMQAAVEQHIREGYQNYRPDSCGSAVHRRFETGDCINGPSVVVAWDDREVWFSGGGDHIEIETYPKVSRSMLEAEIAELRRVAGVLVEALVAAAIPLETLIYSERAHGEIRGISPNLRNHIHDAVNTIPIALAAFAALGERR